MIKNKSKRRKVTILIIILLLLSTAFSGFDSVEFANVRNIDIARIFAFGLLTGVLITTIKDIVQERKES